MGTKRCGFIAKALVIIILLFPCSVVMAQEAGPMYFGVFGGYVWSGKVEIEPLGSTEVDCGQQLDAGGEGRLYRASMAPGCC